MVRVKATCASCPSMRLTSAALRALGPLSEVSLSAGRTATHSAIDRFDVGSRGSAVQLGDFVANSSVLDTISGSEAVVARCRVPKQSPRPAAGKGARNRGPQRGQAASLSANTLLGAAAAARSCCYRASRGYSRRRSAGAYCHVEVGAMVAMRFPPSSLEATATPGEPVSAVGQTADFSVEALLGTTAA